MRKYSWARNRFVLSFVYVMTRNDFLQCFSLEKEKTIHWEPVLSKCYFWIILGNLSVIEACDGGWLCVSFNFLDILDAQQHPSASYEWKYFKNSLSFLYVFLKRMRSTLWMSLESRVDFDVFINHYKKFAHMSKAQGNKNEHNPKECLNRSIFYVSSSIVFCWSHSHIFFCLLKNFNLPLRLLKLLREVNRHWKHKYTWIVVLVFCFTIFHFFRRFMLSCCLCCYTFSWPIFSGSL